MSKIGTVIVSFHSAPVIGRAIDSCLAQNLTVVVVDNANEPGLQRRLDGRPSVRLIVNQSNRGFAGGCNQGAAALNTDFILLMNPDVELLGGLEPLAEACSRNGAAAGMLVGADARPQRGFSIRRLPTAAALSFEALGINRVWRNNPVNRRYRCLDVDLYTPRFVEQPAAAFLMVTREVWRKLGGLDETFYPLWFEDVDFAKRLRDAGYKIAYEPAVVAAHQGAHSVQHIPAGCREVYWYGSLLSYIAKHFRPLPRRVVCLAVMLGSIVRMLPAALAAGSLRPFGDYWKVFRLAGLCLLRRRTKTMTLRDAAAG